MAKFVRSCVLAVSVLCVALVAAESRATEKTVLTGTQEEPVVTLPAGTMCVLRGEYRVPAGRQLHIEAGTMINAEKDAVLVVEGGLTISAAEYQGTMFIGPVGATWQGIRLVRAQRVNMEGAHIQRAQVGVHLRDTKGALLIDCFLPENGVGVLAEGTTEVRLENCRIARNKGSGLEVRGGYAEVEWCSFTANETWGVDSKGSSRVAFWRSTVVLNTEGGIRMREGSHFRARESCLQGNGKYDIVNESTQTQDFARNWWGFPVVPPPPGPRGSDDAESAPHVPTERLVGRILTRDPLTKKPEHCGVSSTRHTQKDSPIIGPHEARITKGCRLVFIEECYGVTNLGHLNGLERARTAQDKAEIDAYVRGGAAFKLEQGTLAVAMVMRGPAYGVRILDGPNRGKQAWVFKDSVACSHELREADLVGKRFVWRTHGTTAGMILELAAGGVIKGGEWMEHRWRTNTSGQLVFIDKNGDDSTVFTRCEMRRGRRYLQGICRPRQNRTYYLEEEPARNAD